MPIYLAIWRTLCTKKGTWSKWGDGAFSFVSVALLNRERNVGVIVMLHNMPLQWGIHLKTRGIEEREDEDLKWATRGQMSLMEKSIDCL